MNKPELLNLMMGLDDDGCGDFVLFVGHKGHDFIFWLRHITIDQLCTIGKQIEDDYPGCVLEYMISTIASKDMFDKMGQQLAKDGHDTSLNWIIRLYNERRDVVISEIKILV